MKHTAVLTLLAVVSLSLSVHADKEGRVEDGSHPEGPSTTTGAALGSTAEPKFACNNLITNLAKEYGFGEPDLGSKKLKGGATESRLRLGNPSGVYELAAIRSTEDKKHWESIFPGTMDHSGKLPAVHGAPGSPRMWTKVTGNKLEIKIGLRSNSMLVTADITQKKIDDKTGCVITAIQGGIEVEEKMVPKTVTSAECLERTGPNMKPFGQRDGDLFTLCKLLKSSL